MFGYSGSKSNIIIMKTIQSTLQLEENEITTAIADYLKVKGYQLMGTIISGNVIQVQVTKLFDGVTKSLAKHSGYNKLTAANRARKFKKHQKVNTGLFTVLKQWFAEERLAGTKEIPFHTVQQKLKANYPHLDQERLSLYLYDRRQLPDIRYKKAEGVVKLT